MYFVTGIKLYVTMSKIATAALIASMSILSCTQDKHYGHKGNFPCVLVIDDKFTNDERQSIDDAIHVWNDSTNGVAQVLLTSSNNVPFKDEHHHIYSVLSTDQATLNEEETFRKRTGKKDYKLLGFVDNASMIYIVVDRSDNDTRTSVVMHELGHHFGLGHSNSTDDIMWPGRHNLSGLSSVDISAFCCVNECEDKVDDQCTGDLHGEMDDPPWWK